MRNRNSLVTFMVMALTLFLASEVLTQEPIEGWDKARLGMSPEELREAYSEEERYIKDKYYRELDYIEKYYSKHSQRRLEEEEKSHGEYKGLWGEDEERWSREDGGNGYPHILSSSWFEIAAFGSKSVLFSFVEDKLYDMRISHGMHFMLFEHGYDERLIEANEDLKHKLTELKNILIQKYGHYSEKKEEKSEKQYELKLSDKIKTIPVRTEILTWSDENGHTLTLISRYDFLSFESMSYDLLSHYEISYSDKTLTELWEKKEKQWREEVAEWAEWEKRGEELKLKGLGSF